MRNYQEFLERKKREYGTLFDPSYLNPDFIKYFESQERIEVKFSWGEIRRGRVGITGGWKPIFILLLTKRSLGSSWTIRNEDQFVKVIR